ncbi:MAG: 30S ribosomal protein S12 methylthiotransferase RimO, partial [Emergencia sp.]
MKIYIETLGCPKNFNDSQVAAGILEEHGFEVVKAPEDADVIMVNTCGFINDAKTESIERIFDMAAY